MDQQQTDNALRDLEAGVLGGLLLKPELLGELPTLELDDFRDLRHRTVFSAMRNLEAAAIPIDVVTLESEIAKWTGNDTTVDLPFLAELTMRVPITSNVFEYTRQIHEAALSRRILEALDGVMKRAAREALTGGEVLSDAMAALSRIDAEQPDTTVPITEIIKRRFKKLDQIAADRISGARTMTGFPTGIAVLDERIGGVQAGIVSVIAARPAMGKSSLGLAISDGSSAAGFGVHTFSLEDAEDPYADRTLSRGSQVPAELMRNVQLSRGQMSEVLTATSKLRGRPWLVDFRSGITADEIVRTVRRHRRKNGTRVVIVDYLQLIKRPAGMLRASTHEVITENLNVLADAAKHDDMAYVIMSQLNREVEKRQDKRPTKSDLRESGSIEERAKCIVGIYRGSYYGPPVKGIDWDPEWKGHAYEPNAAEHAGQVQLLIMKNSNGPEGTLYARWNGPTTRME